MWKCYQDRVKLKCRTTPVTSNSGEHASLPPNANRTNCHIEANQNSHTVYQQLRLNLHVGALLSAVKHTNSHVNNSEEAVSHLQIPSTVNCVITFSFLFFTKNK